MSRFALLFVVILVGVLLACSAKAVAAPPPATSQVEAATVTPSLAGIKYQVKRFSRWRTGHVLNIAAEANDGLSADLLLGLSSRESSLTNVVGGGFFDPVGEFQVTGVDRGLFQINQAFHGVFLRSIPGCDTGTYKEVHLAGGEGGQGALPAGRVPGLTRGLNYAILLLQRGVQYATQQGVPAEDAVQVAVAGYNAGSFNAVRGYREGDVDRHTTGSDYSADVFKRRTLVRRARKLLGFQ